MQTRAAAKKLADAVATVDCAVVASDGNTEAAPAPVEAEAAVAVNMESATKVTTGRTKRKRAVRKQAQPVKGGWVLPHGMGVGVSAPNPSSPQATEATDATRAAASEAVSTAATVGGSQSNAESPNQDQPAAISQSDGVKKTRSQTRKTRLSLRVTKVGVKGQTSAQDDQDPIVKLEEADGSEIEQEDGRSGKRLRAALVTSEKVADATASDKEAPKLALMKAEKLICKQPMPKLLIIKGITIMDNVVSRTSGKIIVDATQILDPNLRSIVNRGKENPYGLTPGFSPYPWRRVPTPDACEEVHRILTELHGEVKQPEKMPVASLEVAGCGEVPCVLDALLRTLISGNTLMALADKAIKNLAQYYGLRSDGTGAGSINWDKVRLSSHQELAQAIKVAGNGPNRSVHIKQILDMVYQENLELAKTQSPATAADEDQGETETGKITENRLSLDHMHSMTKDEAMAKFVSYPGIGIKTAACVTLFCLRMPCFAVDTHVHKFCRWLGWVPENADPDNCFRHGDFMVPDHLKYGLHQLFIRHGQVCFKCRKATKPGTKDWKEAPDCPLEHLLDRSKDEAGSKPPKQPKQPKRLKKLKEETSSEADDSGSSGSDGNTDTEE